nr:hypothetical protein [uncultured Flavobacterium sp.]
MTNKEQLNNDFKNLLNQTEETEFNSARDKILETIFSNSVEEDYLDTFVGEFVLSCEEYLKSNFRESRKNVLQGSFEKILIALDSFQTES